ncbi:MAG TPA: DUF3627 domain-containing protein [Nitrospiraceae bacterium]|nr:DUF3627 domain-containing protein [Nitrospiraceae bacterium]
MVSATAKIAMDPVTSELARRVAALEEQMLKLHLKLDDDNKEAAARENTKDGASPKPPPKKKVDNTSRFVLFSQTDNKGDVPSIRFVRGLPDYVSSKLTKLRTSCEEIVPLLNYRCTSNSLQLFQQEVNNNLAIKYGVAVFKTNTFVLPENMDTDRLVELIRKLDVTRIEE